MARHTDDDMVDEQWEFEEDTPQPTTDQEKKRRTEYPSQVVRTSSREELIECIKRGQRPTWIPQPGFQALRDEEEAVNAQRRLKSLGKEESTVEIAGPAKLPMSRENESKESLNVFGQDVQNDPIERPRSALHRGNFAEDKSKTSEVWPDTLDQTGLAMSTTGELNASPPPWTSDSPRPSSFEAIGNIRSLQLNTTFSNRRRAPSLGSSLTSSFVMRTPTSPLVQATSNIDLDLSPYGEQLSQSVSHRDSTRRRTMPPSSFHSLAMTPIDTTPPNFSRPFAPVLRREASMPSHTHRSRQSLSSFTYHPRSNPQTPVPRSRRLSLSAENHSRRRTSMVGSFEESILRGRMSTPPSKPLDFVAQIGVMGKGDCPSSLKCPAHVTIPFPAVFYSYPASTGVRSVSDDTPSPYVGTIDLQHNLKEITLASKKSSKSSSGEDMLHTGASLPRTTVGEDPSQPSKILVGGAYRVPQQGQLQIIIKNPNKTAVKLFLVPYDLTGMDPGTKTFVRQRSFSTGPIIENALGDKPSSSTFMDPMESKHILRYLVHLRFCCPARNRFYLFDDIRVVFANRVPDGKEKLRNEVQIPEPKFSAWKPLIPEVPIKAPKSAPGTPVIDTFEIESPQSFEQVDGFPMHQSPMSPTPSERLEHRRHNPPPFSFPPVLSRPDRTSPKTNNDDDVNTGTTLAPFDFLDTRSRPPSSITSQERTLSPVTGFGSTTPLRGSPIPWRTPSSAGNASARSSPTPTEDGLLSKQFKQLRGRSGASPDPSSEYPRTSSQ